MARTDEEAAEARRPAPPTSPSQLEVPRQPGRPVVERVIDEVVANGMAPATERPAKKSAARKRPARKTAARKQAAKKATAKKATAKKAPAKEAAAKNGTAKRTPAKKAPAKRTIAKKAPAKRAVTKRAPARRAPAKKTSTKRTTPPPAPIEVPPVVVRPPTERELELAATAAQKRMRRSATSTQSWQQQALARCHVLRAAWAALRPGSPTRALVALEFDALLDGAEAAASKDRWRRPYRTMAGLDVERTWSRIHAAETLLVYASTGIDLVGWLPRIDQRIREYLGPTSAYRKLLPAPSADLTELDAHRAALALLAANDASAAQHSRVRSFRNLVLASSFVLLLVVVALALVGMAQPAALVMCTTGAAAVCVDGAASPGASHVAIVALLGAAGAAATIPAALRRIQGTSTPYAVPWALALLKIPSGALSAVLGLLLVRAGLGGNSGLGTDTAAGLVAWAVVFGASQLLVTRLADLQGQAVLNSVRSGSGRDKRRDSDED